MATNNSTFQTNLTQSVLAPRQIVPLIKTAISLGSNKLCYAGSFNKHLLSNYKKKKELI